MIKKLILISLLIYCCNTFACVPITGTVYTIFNVLKQQLPVQYKNIKLNIIDGDNAYSTLGIVQISTGILKSSKEVIAFTLAHELGHQVLGHVDGYYHASKYEEQDSDNFGLFLYMKVNYCNPKLAILEEYNDEKSYYKKNHMKNCSKTHGCPEERRDRLLDQLKYLRVINKS